jgi:hypothetical protein
MLPMKSFEHSISNRKHEIYISGSGTLKIKKTALDARTPIGIKELDQIDECGRAEQPERVLTKRIYAYSTVWKCCVFRRKKVCC